MNNQDSPVKEQAQPVSEQGDPLKEERGGEKHEQQATPPPRYGGIWQTPPPPSVPSSPAYSTWPTYAPTSTQWWRSGELYVSPYAGRRQRSWPWFVLIVVLLVTVVIAGTLFLAISQEYNPGSASTTTTQHYSVNPTPTIVLNNDTGSIHVQAGTSSSEVIVQTTKHTNGWGNANDVNVTSYQDRESNTITITVERPGNSGIFGSSSVDFDLTVPSTGMLRLKTATGSIDVSGVSGQLVLTSNTGSVEASNGTISSNSQLLTNTGSVTFTGAISATGNYQFQTNTGSVNVTIPGSSIFHVDASTDTGTINTNFPGVVVEHRQFTGADVHSDVGSSPQATITLSTNTGSINLYQR